MRCRFQGAILISLSLRNTRQAIVAACALCGGLFLAPAANAFTHVVQPGETLASIAERYYGRIHYERILVYANSLDACGGFPVVTGMRLEIPAVSHHRVVPGDTWQTLARDYLGAPTRGEVFAKANSAKSWIPPEEGADIIVPYNLRFLVQQRETTVSISKRFFPDDESAWMLDRYNNVNGKALNKGDVVLVPLTDLPLTQDAISAARRSDVLQRSEAAGRVRLAQRQAAAQLPQLLAELRGGHYLKAIVVAHGLVALGELTKPQMADIHRVMTEAYVALGAQGMAAESCRIWRQADPSVTLDEVTTSPKIIAACNLSDVGAQDGLTATTGADASTDTLSPHTGDDAAANDSSQASPPQRNPDP